MYLQGSVAKRLYYFVSFPHTRVNSSFPQLPAGLAALVKPKCSTHPIHLLNQISLSSYPTISNERPWQLQRFERRKDKVENTPYLPRRGKWSSHSSGTTQSCPPPELPQLVAEQHVPIASTDKNTQRLVVVLSHASLETYKASHGGRNGSIKDEKYSLLNSDEHIGVMRKMNRDISDARPDITHQVCFSILD